MKKSKLVNLLFLTGIVACTSPQKSNYYLRGDKSGQFQNVTLPEKDKENNVNGNTNSSINPFLMYYAFRPYGLYSPSTGYVRNGFYSNSLSNSSNFGTNSAKQASTSRSGFGSTARSSSSSVVS
jgi:hypothetical protein